MDDGEGPSPAIIFLSYLTVLCSTHLVHLNESSEGRQPSARTAYDDGSTWHLGGLIHRDLLLAGLPLQGRGRHLVPEPGGGHPLVNPPSAPMVLHNNTADMDEGWENLTIFN